MKNTRTLCPTEKRQCDRGLLLSVGTVRNWEILALLYWSHFHSVFKPVLWDPILSCQALPVRVLTSREHQEGVTLGEECSKRDAGS